MSWTQSDLDRIDKAIASGHLKVRYGDNDVTYRSITELRKARAMVAQELGNRPAFGASYPRTSKGIL